MGRLFRIHGDGIRTKRSRLATGDCHHISPVKTDLEFSANLGPKYRNIIRLASTTIMGVLSGIPATEGGFSLMRFA